MPGRELNQFLRSQSNRSASVDGLFEVDFVAMNIGFWTFSVRVSRFNFSLLIQCCSPQYWPIPISIRYDMTSAQIMHTFITYFVEWAV